MKVFFVDAAHFVHGTYLGYLWCFVRCFIKSPSGRRRFNVLGALDAITKEIITVVNETYINGQSVCDLMEEIAKRNIGIPIKLIMDNAKYQRCKLVKVAAARLKIELIYLPSYSPNLYAPITFKHHIKITYDRTPWNDNDGFWYNIDCLLYAPGTPVKSFSAATPLNSVTLKNTNRAFNDFMDKSAKETSVVGEKVIKSASLDLSPGSSKEVKLQVMGTVRRLLLSLTDDSLDNSVKNLWVQVKFDEKKTIEIPAGFFFGCGDQVVEARI